MFVIKADSEIAKAINRSKLVRQQKQVIRNGKAVTTYVWINPDKNKKKSSRKKNTDEELDAAYFNAIKSGNMDLVQKMVKDRAIEKGFKDAIPEQGNGYRIRTKRPPLKTKTYYKCFYVDTQGRPSALFVDNNAALPTNVWLEANDTYHFMAENGNYYVPTMGNATNKDAGKTGISVKIPDEATRNELIKRGYLPAGSKAKSITCVAYRPGWHGGDLPFFPQGGKKDEKSNYGNVHRWNQVIFEIEVDADKDYTEEARSQPKARKKDGTIDEKKADLQYMPVNGMYEYTTNPKGGEMSLDKLGYTGTELSAARKTLAPITYNDDGSIIPLSQRFNKDVQDIRKSYKLP